MDRRRAKARLSSALIVAAALCVLVAIYAGSYLVIVTPKRTVTRMFDTEGLADVVTPEVYPEYRIGGAVAPCLFWPAHELDRQVRPGTWTPNVR